MNDYSAESLMKKKQIAMDYTFFQEVTDKVTNDYGTP